MSETFSEKLRRVRLSKTDDVGRTISQNKASILLNVSPGTYSNWEATPPRALPDARSRNNLETLWPELFN